MMEQPMVHIYCGDGKGKTTAAAGLAVRAAGAGLRVLFMQFLKGNTSSEIPVLRSIPGIEVLKPEKQYGFTFQMDSEDKQDISVCHNAILRTALDRLAQDSEDVLIFDEVISAWNYGLLDQDLLREILERPRTAEIVLTGRDPDCYLLEKADYVTEMRMLRHPYEKGITARKGIEW